MFWKKKRVSHRNDPHFIELESGFRDGYELDYRKNCSRHLLVVLSSTNRFMMYKTDFSQSVLYLTDTELCYYMIHPKRHVKRIYEFIRNSGFEKVTLMGSSKGATGALLWSSLLSEFDQQNRLQLSCIAFCPQVELYPPNKEIPFPSYRRVLRRLNKRPTIKKCFERYGDVAAIVNQSQVPTTVIYSGGYPLDVTEVAKLTGGHITTIELPITFHGAMVPYMIDKRRFRATRKMVDTLFEKSKKNKDLAANLPENKQELFDQFDGLTVPYITELVDSLTG